jgi:beta-galactosidase
VIVIVSRAGKFIIKGTDTFLYGGECHYFRIPKEEWGQRLDMIIEAGCNLVSTYVPWVWHEIEEGVYDFTGITRPERDLKSFLELVKEKGLYCIVRPGPYVMAEVRYHGVPTWLLEKYPEVIAKKRTGENHPTSVVTYLHPTFLEKVEQWYDAVNQVIAPMQITQHGSIIMYQLCNEIGMFHWVTNTSDYNMDTLQRFEQYLNRKYQTIDEFNRVYKINEPSFASFVERFSKGLPEEGPTFHYEWGGFWREYIKVYVYELRRFAKADEIEVPFIINVHGFKDYSIYSRGVDYPIGLSQLYRTADFDDVVIAGDFYPGHIGYDNYHDLVLASTFTRAISREGQPLFSAEFQSGRLADRPRIYPQDLDLNTRTCVAHGMNALNYYMFVAGENYEDIGLFGRRHEWQAPIDSKGQPRPSYEKARGLGKLFQSIGQRLLNAPKKVHTYVGFNPDDYMTEVVENRDQGLLGELIGKREHFAFDGILRLLVAANIHFEAVDLLKEFTPDSIPSLWVFSTSRMDAILQRKLVNYVKTGGKLILYPEIPTKDLLGNECRILAEELNLGEWELVHRSDTVDVLGIDSVLTRQRLKFHSFDGEVIATYTRKGNKEVAAYQKKCGNGEIIVLGIAISQDFEYQLKVIRAISERMGIKGHLSSDNVNLSLVERCNHLDSFIFITNYDDIEQQAHIFEDGTVLFDGETVTLPPRSGAVYLRHYSLHSDITIEFATVEIRELSLKQEEVSLLVEPIGSTGSIKLRVNGSWKMGEEQIEDHGVVYLRNIQAPLRIILTKVTDSLA